MRLRRFDNLQRVVQEESVTKELSGLESLSFDNVEKQRVKDATRSAKNPYELIENKRQVTGSDLSHDSRRDFGYYKKNLNNYKASLI